MSPEWDPGIINDMIDFKTSNNTATLDSLKIYNGAPSTSRSTISKLVKIYWDCFVEEGIKRPILGFEFAIDTGKHTSVCCQKPRYGPHESIIILKKVKVSLTNGWIEPCPSGGWVSPLVLAPKLHQEHIWV